MTHLIKAVAATAIVLIFSAAFTTHAANNVVVIPMFGSDAKCEWRETDTEPLDTFYKSISSSCLSDEKIITGGFRYGSYNTTKDCRVVASYPLLKSGGFLTEGWRVTWGQPSATECSGSTARTYALCCK